MPIGDGDLRVFYDADGFGVQCARRRPGEDDAPFVAIAGSADAVALDGRAVSTDYVMKYPTASIDLDAGDRVVVGCDRTRTGAVILVGGEVQGGTLYRVRAEPRRANDGLETVAVLSSVLP